MPEGEVAENPTNTETATTEREQTTRNYELDKEIRFVKEQTGRVTSMTAGVIINEEALRTLAKRRYYASLDEGSTVTEDLLAEEVDGDAEAGLEGPQHRWHPFLAPSYSDLWPKRSSGSAPGCCRPAL